MSNSDVDTLTSFLLDLVLLTLRFFPLVPAPAAFPFLPTAEVVFFLLAVLRFSAKSTTNPLLTAQHSTIS